ncbi:MAG TPA: metal ABC transporter substrate-binding protein [Conexibacter sp.]|jgi:zinc/manganese transport system substrate-binding protein|nr:metal ABC transporter substrate-binding protein [Conexibacter sp.]
MVRRARLRPTPAVLVGIGSLLVAGDVDPHWWHDPRNAEAAVTTIRDALTRANPGGRAVYASNAAAYLRRLRALDRAVQACVDSIPRQRRKLVTDHDAFGYFADRYGIEVVGTVIPSLTTEAQPSAGDLAALARTVEREHVRTIFSERSVNAKLAAAIARETGARRGRLALRRHAGPRRIERCDIPRDGAAQRRRDRARAR